MENLTARNLASAFAVGVAEELGSAMTLPPGESVIVVGNAARYNPLLVEALRTRLGRPCELSQLKEAAAYGALRLSIQKGR